MRTLECAEIMSIPITATINAIWQTDHYEYTIEGDEGGIIGMSTRFLEDFQSEIKIEDNEITINDTINLCIVGVDTGGTKALVCRIISIDS